MKSDLVDLEGEIVGETEKAYRFKGERNTTWLPKSQCEWNEDESTMTMPEWLAIEKELV